MKKITLALATFVLLGTGIVKASTEKVSDGVNHNNFPPIDYRYAEPIAFTERGVEFLVFPNGDFDFNTVRSNTVQPRNSTYGAPRTYYGYYNTNSPRGVLVQHDNMGRVRRVGNVFINYDALGRVKRIGSVYMSYNSFALKQVGNLRIIYDRRGRIIDIRGFVNAYSQHYAYTPTTNNHYDTTTVYHYEDNDYGYNNDNDFYYYRKDGSKAKMSETDISEIKRETQENKTRK
ncbi:hypothetical protein NHF50_12095 [Flavobacterium sp. NRK F10]|uniref:hypothetical protein n=1 Tax=Flavobacterium sp. NRK F10 TaxID=2954931 RepID=UPI00209004EA|nr:hypothetical protein [Flavobacterium sp. NRK F10]MCO6175784.1 hypothetical protein [Flavobacterium sp. NRK F10]